MMMIKMTLPEAMATKMATSEGMTFEDLPSLPLFSLLSLDAGPERRERGRND